MQSVLFDIAVNSPIIDFKYDFYQLYEKQLDYCTFLVRNIQMNLEIWSKTCFTHVFVENKSSHAILSITDNIVGNEVTVTSVFSFKQ
jgi:hypothetical protein